MAALWEKKRIRRWREGGGNDKGFVIRSASRPAVPADWAPLGPPFLMTLQRKAGALLGMDTHTHRHTHGRGTEKGATAVYPF